MNCSFLWACAFVQSHTTSEQLSGHGIISEFSRIYGACWRRFNRSFRSTSATFLRANNSIVDGWTFALDDVFTKTKVQGWGESNRCLSVLGALIFSVKGKKIDVVGFKILDSGMVGESVYLDI